MAQVSSQFRYEGDCEGKALLSKSSPFIEEAKSSSSSSSSFHYKESSLSSQEDFSRLHGVSSSQKHCREEEEEEQERILEHHPSLKASSSYQRSSLHSPQQDQISSSSSSTLKGRVFSSGVSLPGKRLLSTSFSSSPPRSPSSSSAAFNLPPLSSSSSSTGFYRTPSETIEMIRTGQKNLYYTQIPNILEDEEEDEERGGRRGGGAGCVGACVGDQEYFQLVAVQVAKRLHDLPSHLRDSAHAVQEKTELARSSLVKRLGGEAVLFLFNSLV
ncbi:hypothetical protein CSUI_005506, partial [Cystoisospora suis]